MGDGIAHLLAFPNFVIFSIVYIASIFLRAPVLIVSEYVKKEISFYSTVHLFKKNLQRFTEILVNKNGYYNQIFNLLESGSF